MISISILAERLVGLGLVDAVVPAHLADVHLGLFRV